MEWSIEQELTDGRPHSAIAVCQVQDEIGNSCVCLQVPIIRVESTRARIGPFQANCNLGSTQRVFNNSWIWRGGIKMLAVGGQKRCRAQTICKYFNAAHPLRCQTLSIQFGYFLAVGRYCFPFRFHLLQDEDVNLIIGSNYGGGHKNLLIRWKVTAKRGIQ